MRVFSDLHVCFFNVISNLIVFCMKKGYSGVCGYD